MINPAELRIGNYILHKASVRILPVECTLEHFTLIAKGGAKDMFPIPLKQDLLLKNGFIENAKYYLLPEAKEFVLALPVLGVATNTINVYITAKNEVYGRAHVNEFVISNNIYYLHQLQNLYYALVGKELAVKL